MKDLPQAKSEKSNQKDYQQHKQKAALLVRQKLDYFNQYYNFKFVRISIRNQRTRWGSCSQRRGLNFNYRLVFLPEPLIDYIIVHELCHLGQMNHSDRFWDLVAKTIPDFKLRRRELKKIKLILL